MEKKKLNPLVKLALEIGPVILFFVGYTKIKDNIYTIFGTEYQGFIVATGVFIPVLLLSTAIIWWLTGKLSRMQIVTAVVVLVFGGLGIYFNDDRFFKMKPTIIYVLFAGVLGFGLMRGQSYLQHVMEEMMPLKQEGWMIFTKRLALFFAALAITNEVIWRNFSTDTWVNFKTFGLTAALFIFFMSQSGLLSRYALPKKKE